MNINGKHVIIDAFNCQSTILNDVEQLEHLLTKTVNALNMEIIYTHFHQFHPQGVTGMIILSTSHMSIHTWPENHYAALDLYTCGDINPEAEVTALLQALEATAAAVYTLSRGNMEQDISCKTRIVIAEASQHGEGEQQ